MNNLQYIIANDTRFAMHMAVELCERGDFDSVNEAFRWLMKERETGKCELIDDEIELLDAMPALKHLAMKAGLI